MLALSQHKTMTAAARSLRLNTGTVSRRLQRFTEETGKTLFVRRGNEWEPTATALPLIKASEQLDQNLSTDSPSEIVNSDEPRILRVSADWEVKSDVIMPNLSRLLLGNPKIAVRFLGQDTSIALGETDLSIGFVEPIAGRLIRAKLGALTYKPYMHRRWKDGPQGYILYNTVQRPVTNGVLKMQKIFGHPKLFTNGLISAIPLLEEMPLTMCLPTRLAARHEDLIELPIEAEPSIFPIWASFHESRRLDPDVRFAIDFVRNCFDA